jgi:DNA ligase-1
MTDNVKELEKFFLEAIEDGCEGLVCKSIADVLVYQAGARGWLG